VDNFMTPPRDPGSPQHVAVEPVDRLFRGTNCPAGR